MCVKVGWLITIQRFKIINNVQVIISEFCQAKDNFVFNKLL